MADEDKPRTLGDFLRAKRQAANMTQQRLAELVGVDQAYIVRLERNQRRNPSGEVLQGIADALSVDVSDLLTYVGVRPSLPEPQAYLRQYYGLTDEEARTQAALLEERNRNQTTKQSNQTSDTLKGGKHERNQRSAARTTTHDA